MSTSSPRFRGKLSPKEIIVYVALALVPLIYVGLLTGSSADPINNLNNVSAVVVNQDAGAKTADGDSLDLGKTLVDSLVTSVSSSNFGWSEMSAERAKEKLASGDIYAILTVPENFSTNAASVGNEDPESADVATLSIETNDGANLIVGSISATIGSTIADTLAQQVSEAYLKNIYLGFTTIHANLQQASDGSAELESGAQQAATGSETLLVGLTDLNDGAIQLDAGSSAVSSGASQAASGAEALAKGLGTLAEQTKDLPAQTTKLNDGAQAIANGTEKLIAGSSSLVSGAQSMEAGASSVNTGATSLTEGAQALAKATKSISEGAEAALPGAEQLADGSLKLSQSTPALASGTATLDTGLQSLLAQYETLNDEQRIILITKLSLGASDLANGAASADKAAASLSKGASALVGDSSTGLTALSTAAVTAATGAANLATASQGLATGTSTLNTAAQSISAGSQKVADGIINLKSGASALSAGTSTLASQSGALTAGIADAGTGATKLSEGTRNLASGAAKLSEGTSSLVIGTGEASSGAETLKEGSNTLAKGLTTLTDNLAEGTSEVPSYTDSQAQQLSGVAAAPVAVETSRLNEVPKNGYGLAPYFLALALWVGALGFYLMSSPLNERLITARRPASLIALRSYLPGGIMAIAQATLAVLILRFGVGIEPANLGGLFGIAILTSLTFVAINQALIALLGAPGRFLALILIVLQLAAAGGTYPVETAPAFFQAIHGMFPLTYTVEAVRSLIAGGTIGVLPSILVLIGWLLGALLLTIFASSRQRRVLSSCVPDTELVPDAV